MRLLFVTNSLDVGGIETSICRLTTELTQRGHSVTVASQDGVLTDSVRLAGGGTASLDLKLGSPLRVVRDVLYLRRLIAREADVVHVFAAKAAILLRVAVVTTRRSRRPPIVSSLMGLQASPEEPVWKSRLRGYMTLVGADVVVVTSPAIGELITGLRRKPRQIIEASVVGVEVPEALPSERGSSLRSSLGMTDADRAVLTIGRLDPGNSHDLFIQGAAIVTSRIPAVHFFIAGGGALESDLSDLIEALGVDDRVHLLGERDDVTDLLSITDICVRPGIVEGFVGVTVLEAQAQKVPVVSFDTRDVRPAIIDGESGLLVPLADVAGLANAIIRLLEAPDLAASIGLAGHNQFMKRFWIDSIVNNLLEIYVSVNRATER